MIKVLLTGAGGMLGSTIHRMFQDRFSVIAVDRSMLNLFDFTTVKEFARQSKPDVIIHTAAYTNVEEAERSPQECYKVNYAATLNLVNSLKGKRTKFIYLSSTGCYGNYKQEAYAEYDPVIPTTVYHKSKYDGENAIRELCDDYLILRLGWLYGGSIDHKKNFVYNRYLEAKKTDNITSDPFQVGNPTNVEDVTRQIEKLISSDVMGTFNVVANGFCSRYEYVKAIIEAFDLPCTVAKADKPFKRLAQVSPNESAVNFNLETLGLSIMKDWKTSLKTYINTLRQNV